MNWVAFIGFSNPTKNDSERLVAMRDICKEALGVVL